MILAVIAQAVTDNSTALLSYGPLGIITAWFMWRGEKLGGEIRTLGGRIETMTRAMLVDVISRESTGVHAKQQARDIMAEIESGKK